MPSEVADQFGVLDTESNRYAWALRRSIVWIVIVALVSGALAAVLIGSTDSESVSRVVVEDASTALASSLLETDGFRDLPTREDVLAAWAGAAVSAVADSTDPGGIVLTAVAPTLDEATAARERAIEVAAEWIRQQRTQAASPVVAVVAARQRATEARLQELDREIDGLQGEGALRDAFLDERASLTAQLLLGNAQLDSLGQYADASATLTVVSSSGSATDTRVLWFLMGAMLGAIGAAIVVLVRAHADRRVRTRSELKILTDTVVLPPVPSGGDERSAAFGAVRAALARLADTEELLIVPADDRAARRFADDLVVELENAVMYSPRGGAEPPHPGSNAVVVISAGRTHSDDVTRTSDYLNAFGCVVVAAVLGDVSPKDLRQSVA